MDSILIFVTVFAPATQTHVHNKRGSIASTVSMLLQEKDVFNTMAETGFSNTGASMTFFAPAIQALHVGAKAFPQLPLSDHALMAAMSALDTVEVCAHSSVAVLE